MEPAARPRGLRTTLLAAGVAGILATLGACGDTSPSVSAATIVGRVLVVGGGQDAVGARPIDAVVSVYRRVRGDSAVGRPIARVATTRALGGRFSITARPGTYFLVADSVSGHPMTRPRRVTVARGTESHVVLRTAAP